VLAVVFLVWRSVPARKPIRASGGPTDPDVKAVPAGASPFDRLDPAAIPVAERFPWQPKELVAVVGSHGHGHWGGVNAVAAGHDGKRLVAVGWPNGLTVFRDTATRRESPFFPGVPHADFKAVAFLPGKSQVVTADNGGSLRLIDGTSGTPRVLAWPAGVKPADIKGTPRLGLECSSDGKWLVAASAGLLWVWEMVDGGPVVRHRVKVDTGATGEGKSLAGKAGLLAWLDGKRSVLVEVTAAKLEQRAALDHEEQPRAVRLSPDGRLLAVSFTERVGLWRWDGKTLRPWMSWNVYPSGIVRFSPNGTLLAHGGLHLDVWKLEEPAPLLLGRVIPFIDHGPQWSFVFGDDTTLTAADDRGYVRFWDLSGDKPHELDPPDWTQSPEDARATWVADNGRISFVNRSYHGFLWETAGAALRPATAVKWDNERHPVYALAPRADRAVLTDHENNRLLLVRPSADGWQTLATPPWARHNIDQRRARAFDAAGNAFYYLEGVGKVSGWNLAVSPPRAKDLSTIPAGVYTHLALAADGSRLALNPHGEDSVSVWDLRSEPPRPARKVAMKRPDVLAISPEGALLAAAYTSGGTVSLWHLGGETVEEIRRWRIGGSAALAFAPNGKTLAVSTTEGQITLYDLSSYKVVREWQFPGSVPGVFFTGDGRHLVTHNGNHTLYVLRLAAPPNTPPGG
jgi:WD40 repeat protein